MQNTHTRKTAYTFFLYFTTDLQRKPNRRFFETEPVVFLKTELEKSIQHISNVIVIYFINPFTATWWRGGERVKVPDL